MKKDFEYDAETGNAICYIEDPAENIFAIGQATCHPDDEKYKSELTGCIIAELRAEIDWARQKCDRIRAEVKILKHLYTNIKTSKYYNPKSYESKMIYRQLTIKENELIEYKKSIRETQNYLSNYIHQKDIVHNRIKASEGQK